VSSRFVVPVDRCGGARRVIRCKLGGVSPASIEIAQLLVSELVSNALIHGSAEATLIIELDGSRLHVEVLDSESTVNLRALPIDVAREHGRGLAIVDALASAWGVEPRYVGKAVWFDLVLE
jgi:anti-sigma regulatory factor (Ser/Thr protein kinase)